MGAKGTVELTREQAEERLMAALLETARSLLTRHIQGLTDDSIEQQLERINDKTGNGLENYQIRS